MVYQNITKGVSFNIVISPYVSNNGIGWSSQTSVDNTNIQISKDGGSFVSSSNSGVYIQQGIMTLQLTAEEMNADKIDVIFYTTYGSSDCSGCVTILTGSSSGGATAQEVWEYVDRAITGGGTTVQSPATMTAICKAVNDGYVVTQIATSESGYNYYGLTSPKSDWWMIIREKTDFTDVDYKMNKENRQTFAVGWSNRATLNYSDVFPLK